MARHRRVAVPRSVFAERILKYLDLYGVMAGTRRLISSIELCRKIVAPLTMLLKDILDSELQFLLFERFDQEIGHSHFHGFDNGFGLCGSRKNDDGNGWIDFL